MINGGVCIDLLKSHYNDIISLLMNCLYCEVKKRESEKKFLLAHLILKKQNPGNTSINVMTETLKMLIFTFSMVTHTDFHCRVPPVEFFDSHPRKHLNIYWAFLVVALLGTQFTCSVWVIRPAPYHSTGLRHLQVCSVVLVGNINSFFYNKIRICYRFSIPKNWEPSTGINAEIVETMQVLTFFSCATPAWTLCKLHDSNVNPDSWANSRWQQEKEDCLKINLKIAREKRTKDCLISWGKVANWNNEASLFAMSWKCVFRVSLLLFSFIKIMLTWEMIKITLKFLSEKLKSR